MKYVDPYPCLTSRSLRVANKNSLQVPLKSFSRALRALSALNINFRCRQIFFAVDSHNFLTSTIII